MCTVNGVTFPNRPVVPLLELLLPGSQKHMSAVVESLPTASASRQPFGTETVSDALIAFIEKATESTRSTTMKMQVRPHLLYLPNQFAGGSFLYRLVTVRVSFAVFKRNICFPSHLLSSRKAIW
jgi:hypothetical protein